MMPTAMEHKIVEILEQSLLNRGFLMISEMILAGEPGLWVTDISTLVLKI